MSLRLRVALLFALATAGVMGVGALALVLQLRASLDASLGTALQARSDALVARLAGGAYPAAGSAEIDQVLDPGGAVLATTDGAGPDPLLSAAQARSTPVGLRVVLRGDESRLYAVAARAGTREVVAVVGLSTDTIDDADDRVRNVVVVGGPPAVALAGFAAWLLAGATLRPVARMRREVEEISAGDPGARLAVPPTRDEIAALATTMNGLLARLQSALGRQRNLVADAGHELRTPLTILKAELELAARPGRTREDLAAAVGAAAEETDRLVRLAEDLLLLARADDTSTFARLQDVDLPDLLAAAARAARGHAATTGVELRVAAGPCVLPGDPDRLRQALDNLIANAVRHAPPGTAVEIGARPDGGWVVVEVRDHGPGFPAEFLPHAFERFRRADSARARHDGGSGLGLAIVRSVAEAHGGTAEAGNAPGGGAVVRLRLPAGS